MEFGNVFFLYLNCVTSLETDEISKSNTDYSFVRYYKCTSGELIITMYINLKLFGM